LENKVEYNKKNKSDGFNVFHVAAKYDNVNILRLLAEKFKGDKIFLKTFFRVLFLFK
jgi:hypothetical protein